MRAKWQDTHSRSREGGEVGSNTGLERYPRDISINARDLHPSRAGFLRSALFLKWQVKYNLLFVLEMEGDSRETQFASSV